MNSTGTCHCPASTPLCLQRIPRGDGLGGFDLTVPGFVTFDVTVPGPHLTVGPVNGIVTHQTMNLHVPSMPEAVKEAYERLMPSRMLFSIKDPDKVVPELKHEQVLGLFAANERPAKQVHRFATEQEALKAIRQGLVPLNDEVEIDG